MFSKNLKILLIIISFSILSYGNEIRNSDIRIEIISQIKVYKDRVEKLEKMYKASSDKNEKDIIRNHINLLKKKIKNLKRVLKEYEKISPPAG